MDEWTSSGDHSRFTLVYSFTTNAVMSLSEIIVVDIFIIKANYFLTH